mgnify:CR=1 FL=1
MSLFKLLKKQKENINVEEEIAKIKDVKPGAVAPEQSNLKFSLLCINLGVDEYAFTLTANHTGKIIVSKSMSREEYKDLKRSIELYEVIEKNLQVVDMTASILARDNKMPMWVFGLNEENSIVNTVKGNFSGTKVTV